MIFDDVFEFMRIDLIYVLAPAVESFKSFHYSLCHALVCFFRASDNGKALGLGDALVPVYLVQTDSDQLSGCLFLLFGSVLFEAVHVNLIKVWCRRIVGFDANAANVGEGSVLFEGYFI